MKAETTDGRASASLDEGRRGVSPAAEAEGDRSVRTLVLRLVAPVTILVAALVLPGFMLAREFRGAGLGPGAWPQLMLWLVAVCCVLWTVQLVRRWMATGLPIGPADTEDYSFPKAIVGLGLILVYGWAIPMAGFAIATATFIAVWCVVGGIRNAVVVLPVSLIGTGALLWLFMGLALMPLPRGRGIFDAISVSILRAIGVW